MAMVLLRLVEIEDRVVASVHLDTAKIVKGRPDPLYVVQHTFPGSGEGLIGQAYLDWVGAEASARAERQLAELERALAARETEPPPDPPSPPPDPPPNPWADFRSILPYLETEEDTRSALEVIADIMGG